MRLHHLEIQAFGPFADRQSVDFDALSSQGLFLLNGPTGAGKSSVLDAVCFALYGSVPGARHAAKRLRSDHAADGVAPEVSLEFSAGGRRYRVVRSPSWERPAKRGGGTTSEQARTLLSEFVAGEWVQKSARNDEAGLELQTLLGMDKDQFTKVVMLPQGEFAAFLRADAKPRRELLQRLFSTARFEDLESHLTEQGHRAAREVSEHEGRQRNLLLRAVEEAERHDVSALELDVDPETVGDRAGAVQTLTEALAERREAAEAQSTDLAERSALADGALSALRRRRERRDALRRLQDQRAEHEALGNDVGPATELLRRHDEALGLSTLLHLEDEARTSADEATGSHRHAVARLGRNAVVSAFMKGDAEAPTEQSGAVLTTACAAATAALTMLRAALPDEERLLALRSQLTAADARLVQIADRTVEIDVELERLRSARSAATRDLAAARVAAEGIEHLRAELTAAETAEALVVQYEDARRRLDTAEDTHRDAAARFLELKEHWLALLQRRLEEAAVELADRLQPGQACAVCGSVDHPRPASSGGTGRITLEEEQSARDIQAAAEEALHEVRDLRDATRLEVADLGARGGGVGRQEAAARVRTARGAVDGAQAAEVRVRSLDRQIERMVQEEDASAAAREALRDEQSTLASRRVSWLEQEASLVERLAELQQDAPSLSARLEAVESAAADLDAARRALDTLLGAQDALTRSRHRLQDGLKDTAFATGDAARGALLHETERMGSPGTELEFAL